MDRRQPAAGRMAGVYFNSDRRIPSFGVPRADRRGRYQAFGRSCALDIRKKLDLLLITAWAGGVLALLYLCLNLVRTRRTTEIPYGVAVSLSLLLMLTHMV